MGVLYSDLNDFPSATLVPCKTLIFNFDMVIKMFENRASKFSSLRKSSAFTLLESVVVITILVIMAGLLFPAVSAVRNSSNAAKCVINLKHIGTTLRLYINDHNNTLPNLPLVPRAANELLIVLGDYMDSLEGRSVGSTSPVDYWICPADPTRGGWARYGAPNGIDGDEGNVGIQAHSYLGNRLVLGFRAFEIAKPSECIFMTDFPWAKQGTRAIFPYDSPWKENYPKEWHRGNMNCLFVDGHVAPLPIKSLVWGGSNTRMWYVDYPLSGTYWRE